MNMKVRRMDCPRSAQSHFALLLGELAAFQKASYAVAYVPTTTFWSRWHRPCGGQGSAHPTLRSRLSRAQDDGRGRGLCFHTLPLGSRMLGLRPMSKIFAARAARAHLPTGRKKLHIPPKSTPLKRDYNNIIQRPAEEVNAELTGSATAGKRVSLLIQLTLHSPAEPAKAGDAVVAPKQEGSQGFYKVWVSDAPTEAE